MHNLIVPAIALVFAFAGCGDTGKPGAVESAKGKSEGEVSEVVALLSKFAPTEIGVEDARIPEKHRGVIKKLVEAAVILDELFLFLDPLIEGIEYPPHSGQEKIVHLRGQGIPVIQRLFVLVPERLEIRARETTGSDLV